MLSRVAERMYWLGRYLERAENMARMLSATTEMMLDAPREAPSLWSALVEILGLETFFAERYGNVDERHVVRYLLADSLNHSSILSSLERARENARTTREILPTEAWEQINDVYWYATEQAARAVTRNNRHPFLSEIIRDCQLLNGQLAGTMSHDAAYHFTRLGRNLERADMTTRVLDLGAAGLTGTPPDQDGAANGSTPYANIRWMSVLLSLSAYQMYHQHVQSRVQGAEVVRFLLADTKFPRTVVHCANEIGSCLAQLPRHGAPTAAVRTLRTQLQSADIAALLRHGLREYLDDLQVGLGMIHEAIVTCWFRVIA